MAKECKCPIWGTPAHLLHDRDYVNNMTFNSPRAGGQFELTGMAEMHVERLDESGRLKLTTWIVDQNRWGNLPANVTPDVVKETHNERELSVPERGHRLVQFLGQRLRQIGEDIQTAGAETETIIRDNNAMLAWTESLERSEVRFLTDTCVQEGLVEETRNGNGIRLTAKGYEFLDQLDQGNPDSHQAFIAMWFDKSLDEAYEKGFDLAIRQSGYKPLRIDRKEHINKIDDEIIAEIRRSRFIVADFTSDPKNPRGGVYFEAGFALGLKIPVIWTCRKDMIEHVHFDTRQFNHIVWTDADDLCTKLKNRIGAVIGDGPLRP